MTTHNPEDFNKKEQILAPQWLLLPDNPVQEYALLISDGQFKDVGPLEQLKKSHPNTPITHLENQLIMPGFIDTHHHLTQAFGKALVFGEPSEIFRRIWIPIESVLDEHTLYLTAKLASLEALRGGFTTVCDAGARNHNNLKNIAQATTEAGIRCILAMVSNDKQANQTLPKNDVIAKAEQHIATWQNNSFVKPSLSIPIPEIATDEMLHRIASLCKEANILFQTHANEHIVAVERSLVDRKKRHIEHLHSVGALGNQTLLAHATLLTPEEIKILQETDTAISYNPIASAWKGNAVAKAHLMDAFNIRVGLGTDNTRSDGFRLMDYAEAAQRFTSGLEHVDFSCGGGKLWLDMATQKGAQILKMDQKIGQIKKGFAADFLLIDLNVPEMTPSWDLSWELVRLANRDQINAVFVDGKIRLWKGWPIDWDAQALMQEINTLAKATIQKAPIQKIHNFSYKKP